MKEKIRQMEELQISGKKLGKTIRKRKTSTWNRRYIKFLLENNEINMRKTSNSNRGMDWGSK